MVDECVVVFVIVKDLLLFYCCLCGGFGWVCIVGGYV